MMISDRESLKFKIIIKLDATRNIAFNENLSPRKVTSSREITAQGPHAHAKRILSKPFAPNFFFVFSNIFTVPHFPIGPLSYCRKKEREGVQ